MTNVHPKLRAALAGFVKPAEEFMKIHTQVLVSELQAIRLFASIDGTRFMLTGVCFEVSPHQTLLVATDGRRLSVLRTEADLPDSGSTERKTFVVPSKPMARLLRGDGRQRHSHKNAVLCTFDTDANTYELNHLHAGYTLHGKLLSGNFPNWRAVVPVSTPEPIPLVGLNLEFLADLRTAGKLLGSKTPMFGAVRHAANSDPFGPWEIQVLDVPQLYHILMSVKVGAPPAKPHWLDLAAVDTTQEQVKEAV